MNDKRLAPIAAALLLPLTGLAPGLASADDATATGNQLETIVVTGTRVQRSVGDSSSPIDVISTAELQKTGAGNVVDALNELLPSFNLPAVTGYDQSAIVRPANLRGLNGDQTLVLVNGKRRHASAIVNVNAYANRGSEPVDLNLIPFAAIDHVEVLRDGAAAQYGSDAIAGVINIILNKDDESGEASLEVGGYDMKDGVTGHVGVNKGLKLPHGGFLNLTLDAFTQNHTDRSGQSGGANSGSPDGLFYYPLPDGSLDPRETTTNPDKVVDGLPDTRSYSLAYNAGIPISDSITAYSFATTSFRHALGYEFFRYASDGAKDPTYNYNSSTGSYTQVYPDGYEPREAIDELDFGVTAGVKGKNLMGWDWDISSTYGKDDDSVSVVNTMNATLGPTSPHTFYAGSWIATELTNNLDLTKAFAVGMAEPLNVSLGAEHRNNSFAVKPGEYGSYGAGSYTDIAGIDPATGLSGVYYTPSPGAQAFPGFNPNVTGHDYRDSFAGYVDFEAKPVKALEVGVAGRFEHYDDFGNTRTGKLSLRYQVIPEVALRGTVSNGFRAPTLGQSQYVATTTNFGANGASYQVGTFPVDSPAARALGATTLQPEKSTNYSAGFVATPIKNLDVTLDLYRIYIRHRILTTSPIGPPNETDPAAYDYLLGLLTSAGLDPVSAAGTSVQYFTNTASTRTQGMDLVTNYRTNFGKYGRVKWSVEANFNQTTITSLGAIPAVLQPVPGIQLIGDDVKGFLTVATPRNKLILGAQYSKGPVHVGVQETRYGHVVDTDELVYQPVVQYVAPAWITDLDVSYDVNSKLTLTLGANNLFDQYPSQTSADFQAYNQGFGKYDALSPYGYFGGFYYGRVAVHF